MKKSYWLSLIVTIVVIFSFPSCVKEVLKDPNEQVPVKMIGTPLNDGLISIKVSAAADNMTKSAMMTMANDTMPTEKNIENTFQAINNNPSITIATWQWTFTLDNFKSSNPLVQYWFNLDPGSKTSVSLIGIEPNGTAHIATQWMKIVYSLDGLPGMITVSTTPLAGGMFSYIIAAHKKGMSGVKGNYGYTGTITNPIWTVTPIAPSDTNYNFVNGALVPAPAGDVGKYVAVRAILYQAPYEIHVGHINSLGVLIWGNFWAWHPNGKFNVSSTGVLTDIATVNLPGVSGDEGAGAIVRKDILASSVVLYTKHGSAFTNGFVQLQNTDGTWQTPIAETAVAGFPNWGKVEILYSAFPTPQILVFRFGPSINSPGILDIMSPSSYWNEVLQVLEVKVVPVNG